MNNIELNEMLNAMDTAERKLTLAVDDAYDRLMTYKLQKEYGVTVECNPNGDRTKVVIDGVVMNQEHFAAWYVGKQLEKYAAGLADYANSGCDDDEDYDDEDCDIDCENIDYCGECEGVENCEGDCETCETCPRNSVIGDEEPDPEDLLPTNVTVDYDILRTVTGELDLTEIAVKEYLREQYDHYLARGCEPTYLWNNIEHKVTVTDIVWGRKR